jgi:glycosyltransferase involved in cell wall biosynthesis
MISVIIPAYNAGRFLAEAIDSVLQQDIEVMEIIVVDDGSTDNTGEVAKSRPVKYIFQENGGVASAMNTGIEASTGSYLASIDADDLWTEGKLQRQLQVLDEHAGVDLVFGHVEQFLCPSLEGTLHNLHLPENAKVLPGYSSLCMLIRREAFYRVGLFNTRYNIGDFVEWYAKAEDAGLKSMMLPEVVARRRIHGANIGVLQKSSKYDYLRIIKASLDRRRCAD